MRKFSAILILVAALFDGVAFAQLNVTPGTESAVSPKVTTFPVYQGTFLDVSGNAIAGSSLASDVSPGLVNSNKAVFYDLSARFQLTATPPHRMCLWYSGLGDGGNGGGFAATSNTVWTAANLCTNNLLDRYEDWFIQLDDAWEGARDANGNLLPAFWVNQVLSLSGVPSVGDTVTFNGDTRTFSASASTASTFQIGGSASATINNIISAIKPVGAGGSGYTWGASQWYSQSGLGANQVQIAGPYQVVATAAATGSAASWAAGPVGGFGVNPLFGITNMVLNVKSMSPNVGVGSYYEVNANGQSSAGHVGTDPAHIRQDATNAAMMGIEFVKLDSTDTSFTFDQKLYQMGQFAKWYKATAAGLGHRAVVKVDMIGNNYRNITNNDITQVAALVDVWGYGGDLGAAHNQGFYSTPDYLFFQTNFDQGFLPMYNLFASKGHWLDWEGLEWRRCTTCGYSANTMNAELSLDAIQAMFCLPRSSLSVSSGDGQFLGTNANLIALARNFTTKPILVTNDTASSWSTFNVFRRDWLNGSYVLLFWNRDFNNTKTITAPCSILGIAPGAYQCTEQFFQTNYMWTNTLTVTLQPGQSHLVICSPLPTFPPPSIWTKQVDLSTVQQSGATFTIGGSAYGVQQTALLLNGNSGSLYTSVPVGQGFTKVVSKFLVEGWTDASANGGNVNLSTYSFHTTGVAGAINDSSVGVSFLVTNGVNYTVYALTNTFADDTSPRDLRVTVSKTGAFDNITNRMTVDRWFLTSQ